MTGRARSSVRRANRDALRKQYSELGRRLLLSTGERFRLGYTDDKLKKVLQRLSHKSIEDVHVAVGRNELPTLDVLKTMFPDAELIQPSAAVRPANRHQRPQNDEGWFNLVEGDRFEIPLARQRQPAERREPRIKIRGRRRGRYQARSGDPDPRRAQ